MERFNISDAIVSLLESEPTFEAQLHEAIRLTAAADFFAPGWEQYLRPRLNYFAAFSFPESEFEEATIRLKKTLERITASLRLNADIKYESRETENLCFYIEWFCLPVESFEFFQQNIAEFEKVKDEPEYNPHPELYD